MKKPEFQSFLPVKGFSHRLTGFREKPSIFARRGAKLREKGRDQQQCTCGRAQDAWVCTINEEGKNCNGNRPWGHVVVDACRTEARRGYNNGRPTKCTNDDFHRVLLLGDDRHVPDPCRLLHLRSRRVAPTKPSKNADEECDRDPGRDRYLLLRLVDLFCVSKRTGHYRRIDRRHSPSRGIR